MGVGREGWDGTGRDGMDGWIFFRYPTLSYRSSFHAFFCHGLNIEISITTGYESYELNISVPKTFTLKTFSTP